MYLKFERLATWVTMVLYGVMIGVEQVFVSVFFTDDWFLLTFRCMSPIRQGILSGIFPLCAMIGSIFAAYISSQRLNTKLVLLVANAIWLVAYMASCVFTTLACLIVTRVLKGIALGVISGTIPVYIKRTLPRMRATQLLSSVQSAIPFGLFLMSLFASQLRHVYQFNGQWFILGLLLVPAILFCPFIEQPDVVPRQAMLTESPESGSGKRLYSSTIGKRNVKRSITAACLTQIGAQFTGINMIVYYIGPICKMTGLTNRETLSMMLALYACGFVVTAAAVGFANSLNQFVSMQYGLRVLGLIHGLIFDCLIFRFPEIVEGILVWKVHRAAALCVLGLCFLFVTVFSLLISGPVAIFTAEVVPDEYRELGVSIAVACGWLSTSVIACLGPLALTKLGFATFLALSLFCGIMSFGVVALSNSYGMRQSEEFVNNP